ncbi:hypothetical protein KIN20_007329 [Parelaphostrongylus tenuis]|uniref:Uncharacterized protein n=1 Tax=Parelaphostrongylus tenuis TaxID=148309 RepID=A0AAD5QGS7_PARTN|nr:hypothetical protein KIN20_007329 [Parelaphostrongylus tenuis]
MNVMSCIIVGSTVTGICPADRAANMMCQKVGMPIEGKHLSLSGTLTVWTAFLLVQLRLMKKKFYVDYEHHHG